MNTPVATSGADVLIAGAGPAGLALATALARGGLRVQLLDPQPLAALQAPADDGREIALTHRARGVLESLGLWGRFPADAVTPLVEARVSSGASPFVLPFSARRAGHEALGWLVPNHRIRAAAFEAATAQPGVALAAGPGCEVVALERAAADAPLRARCASGAQFEAPLLVAADSRFSSVRRLAGIGARMRDFGRIAILARVEHDAPHDGVAHECFAIGHTLATLPMPGRASSIVLTVPADAAPGWLALTDAAFAARVEAALGGRLGRLRHPGPRRATPLVAVYAERFAGPRFALAGDAAVGMHPVTAHGYNFGLYGIEVLARELAALRGDLRPPAALDAALQRYAAEHRRTTAPIYEGTNAIVRLFTDDRAPARLLRGAVLRAARALPPVQALITRQLVGAR